MVGVRRADSEIKKAPVFSRGQLLERRRVRCTLSGDRVRGDCIIRTPNTQAVHSVFNNLFGYNFYL